jgi:dipeptidyl aminopeptidase/acylaminoacyl peptidase
MKARTIRWGLAAAIATGTLVAADTPLTPAQALDRSSIADLQFSPDGARLVFTVAAPPKGAARPRSIWLLDVASGRTRQLTFSGKSDGSPRFAPDGRSIAFTSDRDGVTQLYLLPTLGGEPERLTDRQEAVGAFRWSPDGTRIALLMAEPKPEALQARERDKDDGRRVDKDERRPQLWMLDVATKALVETTPRSWRIDQIEWPQATPTRLIVAATTTPAVDRWTEAIFSLDVAPAADGALRQIAAPAGPFGDLSVSPDGRTIAYVGARVDGPAPHDLFLQPAAGGAAVNLTATRLDRPIADAHWIDDRTLIVRVARGFKSALATIGRDGGVAAIDDLDVNPSAYARAANGTLAYAGETTTRPPEVFVKTPDARATRVTSVNSQSDAVPIVSPEFVTYKSYDGREIEAALLRPRSSAGGAAARRAPFVVLVHGGPTGRWTDAFEPWGQLLAARGYAVLYPNVRGSTGYGQRFVEMNRGDWGGGDFKDVMAGVDEMIARGVADPDRLGIGGWSYGGYMAAWAVTQTTRFKAAVSGAPVIDLASEFGTETGPQYDEWFYGTPYERLDGFVKSSPMTFVRHVRTPTLLLQGENDTTDPIGQSQQFYRGLKRYGVDAELVVYPREPHGFREEKHLLDRLSRILAWYDAHLTARTPPTADR